MSAFAFKPNKCKSRCYKYKTKGDRLCDKTKKKWSGFFNVTEYCDFDKTKEGYFPNEDPDPIISNDQTINYGYCYDEDDKVMICDQRTYNKDVKSKWALFLILVWTTPIATVSSMHLTKKITEGTESDKELLELALEKFKDILKSESKLANNEIEGIINGLNKEIKLIPEDNPQLLGKYFKKIIGYALPYIDENVPFGQPTHTEILRLLVDNIKDEDFVEALKGANYIINDGGEFYDKIGEKSTSYKRFSSHYNKKPNESKDPQLGITSFFADSTIHVVAGTLVDSAGKRLSWFQTEGAPNPPGENWVELGKNMFSDPTKTLGRMYDFTRHATDFIAYKTLRKNIGSLGASSITDKAPKLIEIEGSKLDFTPEELNNFLTTILRPKIQELSQDIKNRGIEEVFIPISNNTPSEFVNQTIPKLPNQNNYTGNFQISGPLLSGPLPSGALQLPFGGGRTKLIQTRSRKVIKTKNKRLNLSSLKTLITGRFHKRKVTVTRAFSMREGVKKSRKNKKGKRNSKTRK